jgi:hypothetical protein
MALSGGHGRLSTPKRSLGGGTMTSFEDRSLGPEEIFGARIGDEEVELDEYEEEEDFEEEEDLDFDDEFEGDDDEEFEDYEDEDDFEEENTRRRRPSEWE